MDASSYEEVIRGGHEGRCLKDLDACVGVIVADRQGVIVHANLRAMEKFGYTLAELIGKPLTILMDVDSASRHDTWFRQWWEHGRETREMGSRDKVYGLKRDGQRIPLAITITGTIWYDEDAAMAVFLPSTWIGEVVVHIDPQSQVSVETKSV